MQFYKSNGNLVVASHHIVMLIFLVAPTVTWMCQKSVDQEILALDTILEKSIFVVAIIWKVIFFGKR